MMFRKRSTGTSTSAAASSSGPGLSLRAASSSLSSEIDLDNRNSNGTMGGHVESTPSSSPVLIQRFIILHDGLMPRPPSKSQRRSNQRRNPQAMLSENASLDEIGEFILYYYDHSLHFSQEGNRRPLRPPASSPKEARRRGSNESDTRGEKTQPDHATEEAVRFANLCRALRLLPVVLRPDRHHVEGGSSGSEDEPSETEVVHLKDSTLVFASLELGGDIVAIAQIPRAENSQATMNKSELSQSQYSRTGFGADPSAIKAAMQHIHATFSLLNGGGIHRQLIRTKHLEGSKDWVFDVIDDDDKDEDDFFSRRSSDDSERLKRKESSTWEVGVPSDDEVDLQLAEPVDKKSMPSKVSRRKPRRLKKKLSSSFSSNHVGLHSSFNSDDGNQKMSAYHNGKDNSVDYRYGGMEELFNLRREHRKLSEELREDTHDQRGARFGGLQKHSRWSSNSNAEDLFNDIANDFGHNDVEQRLENLLKLLPITKLRDELVQFYDEWLFQMQGVCGIMHGGLGRCVVDMVPFPSPRGACSSADGPLRGQHPPLSPNAFVCLAASEFMKSLLYQEAPKLMGSHGCRLSGMSMFYENRLVLSEFTPSCERSKLGQRAIALPPEIPYTIIEYLRSSQKRQIEASNDKAENAQDDSEKPVLARWMSGLSIGAANNNNDTAGDGALTNGNEERNVDASPGYVANPFSTKDSDRAMNSLYIRNIKKNIWLQRIYLQCAMGLENIGLDDGMETYVAMFESEELSFLLFFEMPSPQGGEGAICQMAEEMKLKTRKGNNGAGKHVSSSTQAFVDALTFIGDQLAEFCNTHSSQREDSTTVESAPSKEINSERLFLGEPGIDIICVDRDECSFVLLSQHDLASDNMKRAVPKKASSESPPKPKFGLFGLGPKPKEPSEEQTPCHKSQYSNMLDCRHKLSAHLPLDVMLAFDDMFNEIGSLSGRKNVVNSTTECTDSQNVNNCMGTAKSIELCTFLPHGWVYARAFGNVELYILMDTKKFVTINDVQKAVTRVRERLFNDVIR